MAAAAAAPRKRIAPTLLGPSDSNSSSLLPASLSSSSSSHAGINAVISKYDKKMGVPPPSIPISKFGKPTILKSGFGGASFTGLTPGQKKTNSLLSGIENKYQKIDSFLESKSPKERRQIEKALFETDDTLKKKKKKKPMPKGKSGGGRKARRAAAALCTKKAKYFNKLNRKRPKHERRPIHPTSTFMLDCGGKGPRKYHARRYPKAGVMQIGRFAAKNPSKRKK